MPTCDRLEYMRDALASLLQQVVDFHYEILVLDNDCDSEVEAHVHAVAAQATVAVEYVAVVEKGLHNCRHLAARTARGSILALVDDDIIADPNWLASVEEAFADPLVQLVTGPVVPAYEAEVPDWLELFWHRTASGGRWCGYLSLLDLGLELRVIDPMLVFGVNFAIRTDTLFKLGGFNPDSLPWRYRRYRGDGETAVAKAARKRGLKAVYHPGACVHHRVPAQRLTAEYFEKRAFLQGISDSFSEYRNSGPADNQTKRADLRLLERVAAAWRLLSRLFLKNGRTMTIPAVQSDGLLLSVKTSRQQGYQFHRQMLDTDPSVRQWVQREDFWDGRLPDSADYFSH